MKKIILLSSFFLVPILGFANGAPERKSGQTAQQNQDLNKLFAAEIAADNEKLFVTRTPKSQQGSDALNGTWFFSYADPTTSELDQQNGIVNTITDKIIINGTILENDQIAATGKYYPNQAENGSFLLCLDYSPDSSPDLYTCVTQTHDADVVTFDFSLVKNSDSHGYLSSGYFGSGLTFDKSREDNASKTHLVTGYRESEQAINASYNETNGELDIPSVDYNGSHYYAVLQNEQDENEQDDFVFTIKELILRVAPLETAAIYNENEHELDIPVLDYQGSEFSVILQDEQDENGDLLFTIKETHLLTDQ